MVSGVHRRYRQGLGRLQLGICCNTRVETEVLGLGHWLSTFLMLQPFKTVPHVVVTPTVKLYWFLLQNCKFDTVIFGDPCHTPKHHSTPK